jgi:hypothetical protein
MSGPAGGVGTLLHYDAGGELTGQEPAPDDIWITHDDARPPGASSVTPAGEVLAAVLSPDALRVVALAAAG